MCKIVIISAISFLLGYNIKTFIRQILSHFTVICIFNNTLSLEALRDLRAYQNAGCKLVFLSIQPERERLTVSNTLNNNRLQGSLYLCDKPEDIYILQEKLSKRYNILRTIWGWSKLATDSYKNNELIKRIGN